MNEIHRLALRLSEMFAGPALVAGAAVLVAACSDSSQVEEPNAEPSVTSDATSPATTQSHNTPFPSSTPSGSETTNSGAAGGRGTEPQGEPDPSSNPTNSGGGGMSNPADGGGAGGAAGIAGFGGASEVNPDAGDSGGMTGSAGGTTSGAGGVGGTGGGGSDDDEPSIGIEFGFELRAPATDELDWLCTFGQSEPSGYVYVRLHQTGMMQVGIATIPVYETSLAQLSIEGVLTPLDNAAYDYGGGHHNDSLSFDYEGRTYEYYHSSFGFGFRACQPMDCINIDDSSGEEPAQTGCGPDRALPEVCVQIAADGTHEPLEDRFQKCPGDQG